MNKVSGVFGNVSFKMKKHSPEILMAAGVAGVIVSAVMACKATLKVDAVMDETKEKMDKIHTAEENGPTEAGEDYSKEDAKKDTVIVYAQTGLQLAKTYAPAVAIGALSIASILASNNILRKRNVALTAAYTVLDTDFKNYRSRVIEKFGKEIDRELKYNIKAEKVSATEVDAETGKEKKVKKNAFVVNPSDVSGYARFFEKYTVDEDGNSILNPHWEPNNEYNIMFIKAQENYANDLLRAKKRLFLNDVYEMLGLPRTKAGQVVGWVYDKDNPVGDNYVDFGLYTDNLSYSDFANGLDPAILLDFNVDGNIWEMM
ncbi:DUF6353 family protein [Bacteroides congonensis]|uniref:DUF6353 family protein n=1 Tax=Bacteroides congonensis TaxID=1871006 RepID=UPI0025A3C11E|nr:DUF6353 family protein [Bacteroides congonensis]